MFHRDLPAQLKKNALATMLCVAQMLGSAACSDDQTPGAEGNPCYQNDTCNAGLSCLSGFCVKVPEPDGGRQDGLVVDSRRPDGPRLDASRDAAKRDGPSADFERADTSVLDFHPPLDRMKPDAPQVENTYQLCTDKKDNDGDGKIDCADPDCRVFIICQAVLGCTVLFGCDGGTNQPAGSEGGSCYSNQACDDGLTCLSGICVRYGKKDGGTQDAKVHSVFLAPAPPSLIGSRSPALSEISPCPRLAPDGAPAPPKGATFIRGAHLVHILARKQRGPR